MSEVLILPENKKELEELKKGLRTNEKCDRDYPFIRCKKYSLNMRGKPIEEALKTRFSGCREKKTFGYSQHRKYCYNETNENDKKPVFRKRFKS